MLLSREEETITSGTKAPNQNLTHAPLKACSTQFFDLSPQMTHQGMILISSPFLMLLLPSVTTR